MNCDTFTNRDKEIVTYKDRDTVTNIDTVADRDRDIVLGRVRDTVTNRDGGHPQGEGHCNGQLLMLHLAIFFIWFFCCLS